MPDRSFTPEEVQALIRRAAELQAAEARGEGPGLSLDELEAVARDSGLDPRHVRAAATELRTAPKARPAEASTTHVHAERIVPGALTDDAIEAVVADLRHRFDSDMGMQMYGSSHYGKGRVERVGRSVEWAHTSMMGIETRVLMQPRGDGVRVRASRRVGYSSPKAESVGYGVTVSLAIAFIVWPVTGSLMIALAALLALLVVSTPLIYRFDVGWRGKAQRELDALADSVAESVAAHAPAAARQHAAPDGPPLSVPPDDLYGRQDASPEAGRTRDRA
jgi:hypothetical protein